MQISVDGTVFTITSSVKELADLISQENRAALRFPIASYADTLRSIMGELERRYGPESRQLADLMPSPLHCGSCLKELPRSVVLSAMGMSYKNLPAGAAACPHCRSGEGLLIYEHFVRANITATDVEAIGNYWLDRARRWWAQQSRTNAICDSCNGGIPRGGGYLISSDLVCERCCTKTLQTDALEQLRRDPHYFGSAIVRKARPFRAEEI